MVYLRNIVRGAAIFVTCVLVMCSYNVSKAQSGASAPTFDVAGFFQQQLIFDQTPDSPTRFYIHRARLGVTGTITENISINLIGGYSEPPDNTPRLVNGFVDFDIHPLLQLRAGQFLLPFGLESPEPIFLNPAIERSLATRRLNTFTMFRDVGVQASGRNSSFNYAAAVVNGAGANNLEETEPKDVMGRVGIMLLEELELGLSGHLGRYQPDPLSDNDESRQRAGVDISYEGDPVFVRGEYILRQDEQPGGNSMKMNGGHLLAGYQVTENLEAIARFEYYEPNTDMDDDTLTAFTIGASYYFIENTRLSVNYDIRDDQLNPDLGNLLVVQMQVAL
ncbi:MAG: porin [Balneolaceae bacterium]|nr:porin [Balneolaceae bacterium]